VGAGFCPVGRVKEVEGANQFFEWESGVVKNKTGEFRREGKDFPSGFGIRYTAGEGDDVIFPVKDSGIEGKLVGRVGQEK